MENLRRIIFGNDKGSIILPSYRQQLTFQYNSYLHIPLALYFSIEQFDENRHSLYSFHTSREFIVRTHYLDHPLQPILHTYQL